MLRSVDRSTGRDPGVVGARGCCDARASAAAQIGHDFASLPIDSPHPAPPPDLSRVRVSEPDDAMEREAESVAASMLSPGPAPGARDPKAVVSTRLLLRRSTSAMPGGSSVPLGPLSDSGQPLPRTVRDFFEPRLGMSFAAVRIHSDARAAAMSRSVRAEAFTWGPNIVFGDGRYTPSTSAGQRLLAHELVHVAQQEQGAPGGVVMRRWDAATAECAGQPITKWIERVVVEQETPQSVTLQWSDRSVEAGTASAGKGHCCVDPTTADGTACSVQESRRNGSNCTPITDGNGLLVRHRDLNHQGISFWTEFEPARAIALHTYSPVDGTPLSHGCVRLNEQTAKTIFCGVRQSRSRVDVRGFPRPRCDHPTLQREWMSDFTLAGTDVPDGDPAQASSIREERRALNEAFGRRLTVQELRGFTAADIPRCTSQAARPTAELPVTEAGGPRSFRCNELARVRELSLNDVDSLDGIVVLSALERLRVDKIARAGLIPLTGMRRLRVLEQGFRETLSTDRPTSVEDLTPLRGLDDLEVLHVRGARVRDLTPIAALRRLRELDLELNLIASLDPLRELPQLEQLNVADNAVQELAVLRGLTRLAVLTVSGNKIKEIAALGGLPALRELDVSDNPLRSVEPLAALPAIEAIRLNRTAVEDIRPLHRLSRLKSLYFCTTPAESGAPWKANAALVAALRKRGVNVICREACRH